jgi:hypothetical protein
VLPHLSSLVAHKPLCLYSQVKGRLIYFGPTGSACTDYLTAVCSTHQKQQPLALPTAAATDQSHKQQKLQRQQHLNKDAAIMDVEMAMARSVGSKAQPLLSAKQV